MILGDNGNIYRIVGTGAANGVYTTFNYDTGAGYALRIIPRAVDLLDYTPAVGGTGAGDFIHGEAGDDTVHGQAGHDTLYGDGQDDDLYGEAGNDWISGGTGEDGVLGDDGKIMTSRNGIAEPLDGIVASTQQALSTNGDKLDWTVNQTGRLAKAVDLAPFELGGNDTIYGGRGDDSLHGGSGNDAMSGAEALEPFYGNPGATPAMVWDAATGDFVGFDDYNPLKKIGGHLLNFESTGAGNTRIDDGSDKMWGGDGNDWMVGGTGRDQLFGGFGNDILNADDNLETNGGLNNAADTGAWAEADTAFGGGGRDTLIGNTADDRLIDWSGEYNAFVLPWSGFGQTVIRSHSPSILAFLIALSRNQGADHARTGSADSADYGELGVTYDDHGGPSDPQGPATGGSTTGTTTKKKK
jgi:Ca2+-binding RTX toxin-like protein